MILQFENFESKAKDCMPVTAWDEDTTWNHEFGSGRIVLTEKTFFSFLGELFQIES